MLKDAIMVTISGPDHSGKGHVLAAIAHQLEAMGCEVSIQGADTRNAGKLAKDDSAISERLKGQKIILLEMRT